MKLKKRKMTQMKLSPFSTYIASVMVYIVSGIRNIVLAAHFSKDEFSINFLSTLIITLLLLLDFGNTYKLQNTSPSNGDSVQHNSDEVIAARKYLYVLSTFSTIFLGLTSLILYFVNANLYALALFSASVIFPLQYSLTQRMALMIGSGRVLLSQIVFLAAACVNLLFTTLFISTLGILVILLGPVLGFALLNLFYWKIPVKLDSKAALLYPSHYIKKRFVNQKSIGVSNFYSYILINIDFLACLFLLNSNQTGDIAFLLNLLTLVSVLPITLGNILINIIKTKYSQERHSDVKSILSKTRNLLFCLCILEINVILIASKQLIHTFLPSYFSAANLIWIYGLIHLLYISTFYSSNLFYLYGSQYRVRRIYEVCGVIWVLLLMMLALLDSVSLERLMVLALIRNLVFFILHARLVFKWGNFSLSSVLPYLYFVMVLFASQFILNKYDLSDLNRREFIFLCAYLLGVLYATGIRYK